MFTFLYPYAVMGRSLRTGDMEYTFARSLRIFTHTAERDRMQGKLATPGEFCQAAGLMVVSQILAPPGPRGTKGSGSTGRV